MKLNLFAIILPLIAVYVTWSFGELPATSMFWSKATVEVTGYDDVVSDYGYGEIAQYYPEIQRASGETMRLNTAMRHDGEAVRNRWPVGTELEVRLHPNGRAAYILNDPRQTYFAPQMIAVGALLIIAFSIWASVTGAGVFAFVKGAIGTVFVTASTILFVFLWTFGQPPATSFFWPTENVVPASSTVEREQVKRGLIAWHPRVTVTRETGETVPLRFAYSGFLSEAEATSIASDYAIGTTRSVRVSPDEELFARRWHFPFTLALVVSILAPITGLIGIFMMISALRTKH